MSENVGGIYYTVSADTKPLLAAERQTGRSLERIGQEGDKLQAKFSRIGAAIAAALSAIAIEGLVSKIVTAQRSFDTMFASLKTMTGGVDQASVAWERLTKFAAQTPFSLEQSVNGFVKLKALGLDPTERAMTSFGNTASAMGKSLSQMIEAVADASTSEFERLKEFGIKAKQEGDRVSLTFQGVTTTIGNNSREITEYLTRIGEVNFAGAMSERMKTLDGDISNLEDSLQGLYLAISQSGVGDSIAAGVRKASEAIAEMTASVRQGGMTEYFDGLRPVIAAAEVAVVTLAGAIAGRLVQAMLVAGVQAYTTAAAMGAATVAARGFTAVMAALGGPIGIAVTALALLALNWNKITGSAKTAAEVSENAASRIAAALALGGKQASRALQAEIEVAQNALAKLDTEIKDGSVRSIYGDRAPVVGEKRLADLKKQRDEVAKVVADIQTAMGNAYGSGRRPANEGGGGLRGKAGGAGGKAGGGTERPRSIDAIGDAEMDFQSRLDAWWRANEEALDAAEERAAQNAADAASRMAQDRAAGQAFALDTLAEGDPLAELALQLQRKTEMLMQAAALDQENAGLYADARVALEQRTAEQVAEIRQREVDQQAANNQMSLALAGDLAGSLFEMLKRSGKERTALGKTLFLASKALAVAEIILNTEVAAAKAGAQLGIFGLPMAAMIRATGYASAGLVGGMALGDAFGGGRQYGGPTNAGTMYRVNELGRPEMFTAANGAQYMMPTQSGRVTAADQVGSAPAQINIHNYAGADIQATSSPDGRAIDIAVRRAKAEIAAEIGSNTGDVFRALRSATNVQPKQG